ncbi:neuronal acetylcholine receptor subunit alpha-2-like [Cotesia glomerata]|uniref:neuronal acetylcholine receptor subunit alpha-2-like n=1 Tax=Cotesia glomerata TaxID=32391 RepID=UPI001D0121C8|nr:neuronal acetylcholine receptor subunit alpha-2-like [Cotesia glomerata]
MSLVQYIFILTFFNHFLMHVINGQSWSKSCNLVEEKSPYLRLKRHLLCDYDPSVRPTINFRNRTDLSIVVVPKLMDFNEFTNVMKLHTWMYIAWKDPHLQWKPEEFDGVDSLYVMSHEIWTPDITIVNAGFGEQEIGIPLTSCILSKDGRVACVPIVCYSTRCHRDHTYWPFDQQHCSFEYASWSYNTEEIYLSKDSFRLQMIHFVPNAEWKINNFKVEPVQKKSKYTSQLYLAAVSINFNVERVNSMLRRMFITPIIVVMMMTLATMWFDSASKERLIIACINFIIHFLCLSHLHWRLSAAVIPNILIFYHSSMILATSALILTCIFRKLVILKTSPPTWVSSTILTVLVNKYGQVLLSLIFDLKASAKILEDGDDSNDLINSEFSKTTTWNDVIVLLNWIILICFVFIYIIMCVVFIHIP